MLLTDSTLGIVDARAPLLLDSDMEGLDARDALPPLVRPDLLCDVEGYDAWERSGIAILAQANPGYLTCLDDFAAATEHVRQWKPGGRSLTKSVQMAFVLRSRDAAARWSQARTIERVARLTAGATGDDLLPVSDFDHQWYRHIPVDQCEWFDRGMKNYLAARLFGNWIAYQGRGLRSIVEWLRTCAAVVHHFLLQRMTGSGVPFDRASFLEAVRAADLLLLHVLHSGAFARDVASIEE